MNTGSLYQIRKKSLMCGLVLISLLQGCVSLDGVKSNQPAGFLFQAKEPSSARQFFQALDEAVSRAKTRDTSHFAVPGFPYLRANRFLVGLKESLDTDQKFDLWLQFLFQADQTAREKEIQNLPYDEIYALAEQFNLAPFRPQLMKRMRESAAGIFEADLQEGAFKKELLKAVEDPTEYSKVQRITGLYPVVSLPVMLGAKEAYKEFKDWHKKEFSHYEAAGEIEIFTPSLPLFKEAPTADDLKQIFRPARRNILGMTIPDNDELENLVFSLAPIYYQDVAAEYDRFGKVVWKDGEVTVDTTQPTVYYYATYNFIKGKPVLQLNYSIWYTERSGPNAPAIERGKFDGLTMRITLDENGWPVMTDFMNSCGCYHFYVPGRDYVKEIIPKKFNVDPLVVSWQPGNFPKYRLNVKINSGWHQVQRLRAWSQARNTTNYQLLPYDVLESLSHEDGHRESIFDELGIMKGSERKEDVLFYSMGIPKVGYMRQRLQHPTKLVGQAHFTDPDIFDANFIFK